MIKKRPVIIAALFFLLAFPASASMVSFLLVETGISQEASNAQYASLWESGLMDAFFNAGHIITNGPTARFEKRPSQDISGVLGEDFQNAAVGGAEYYILGYLEYKFQDGSYVPAGITLKVYRINTKKLIFEQNFPAGSGKTKDDEYKIAQDAGRILTMHVKD